jgi:hypothetical protein
VVLGRSSLASAIGLLSRSLRALIQQRESVFGFRVLSIPKEKGWGFVG